MTGTAPGNRPATTPVPGTTLAPEWDGFLDRLDDHARDAEAALASGEPFTWPELALPRAEPTAAQRERADRVRARMVALLEAGQARRDELLQELSGLTAAQPRRTPDGILGSSLDVLG